LKELQAFQNGFLLQRYNVFKHHESCGIASISATTQNFLVTLLDFDKTARYEMWSSDRIHLLCFRFPGVRCVAAAFPCESRAAN
jgi:hypothetical protein